MLLERDYKPANEKANTSVISKTKEKKKQVFF